MNSSKKIKKGQIKDFISDSVAAAIAEAAKRTRPEKRITNTSQYTAVIEDKDKYLVFNNGIEFIIPANLFSGDDEIEGDAEGGDVIVTAGSGVTILKVETQTTTILKNGPFGMRFKTANKLTLMGALKPI